MNMIILLLAAVISQGSFTMERVVAVVGAEPVLHSDVVTLMIESGIDESTAVISDTDSDAYREALDQVITDKLLVEAARREGVYPSRDEIQDAVDESMSMARSAFDDEEQFLQYLASMGMTVGSLRASYEAIMGDRLAGQNFVRTRASQAMAGMPSDPVTYFQEHPETVESVLAPRELSWIYIPVLPVNADQETALLTEVRERIESGEITFSAAAAEYSQDGSAATGGDLGWFERGDMTSTFESEVYSLETGRIAGPFATPFGIHLAKLTDRDGESIRASHILRMVPVTQADFDSAMAVAEEITYRLGSGESFSALAAQFSRDPQTFMNGGDLGTVNVGVWEGELRNAVIDLEPGSFSDPVPVEQNLAVAIFLRENGGPTDWSVYTTEELESMLQSVFWNEYYDAMVDSLSADIPVEYNI